MESGIIENGEGKHGRNTVPADMRPLSQALHVDNVINDQFFPINTVNKDVVVFENGTSEAVRGESWIATDGILVCIVGERATKLRQSENEFPSRFGISLSCDVSGNGLQSINCPATENNFHRLGVFTSAS